MSEKIGKQVGGAGAASPADSASKVAEKDVAKANVSDSVEKAKVIKAQDAVKKVEGQPVQAPPQTLTTEPAKAPVKANDVFVAGNKSPVLKAKLGAQEIAKAAPGVWSALQRQEAKTSLLDALGSTASLHAAKAATTGLEGATFPLSASFHDGFMGPADCSSVGVGSAVGAVLIADFTRSPAADELAKRNAAASELWGGALDRYDVKASGGMSYFEVSFA